MIRRSTIISFLVILLGATAGYFIADGANRFLTVGLREKTIPDPADVVIREDTSSMELPLRIVDIGGVGVVPDTANWGDNYEHNQHFFEDVMLVDPPFVDEKAFAREKQKLIAYVERMGEFGYNAIAIPWFLEFVDFEKVGNGNEIYTDNSLYKRRHRALRDHFRELMQVCDTSGLKTYLWTDMVSLTTPLKNYFEERFGSVDTENPELWKVYEAAAREVFESFPDVDGIIIRIGEAGSIYNKPGWDYFSELDVRTDEGVRNMLRALLAAAEDYNKRIIFRTWSVGVGKIGDMHTSTETYHKIMDSIQSDNLLVSTKYCRGDFYSWLELNPTLYTGDQKRIAEFQAKREFEGFGAIPNYVAPLHQIALQSLVEKNPRFEGVWVWTQYGGPLRAGPMIIYPFYGFNVINDANVYALSRLVIDPYSDLREITGNWVRNYFGEDTLLVSVLSDFLMKSYDVMKRGLYISDFARYDVRALGLEPPPMLWIFEWDILGASSSVLSNIYDITKDNREAVVAEGFEAARQAAGLMTTLESVQDHVSLNNDGYEQLIHAADYEKDLFTMLAYYRQFFMRYYFWLDTGDDGTETDYKLALGQFRATRIQHEAKYKNDLNTLGFEFFEADQGLRIADNSSLTIIMARVILVLILFLFLIGLPGLNISRGPRKFAASLLFDSVFRPHRISNLNSYYRTGTLAMLSLVLFAAGIFTFSSFAAIIFPVSIVLIAFFYMILLPVLFTRRGDYLKGLIALAGPKLMILTFFLLFVAWRSPMFFWYQIWTSDLFRTMFFAIFIMLIFRRIQLNIIAVRKWSERNVAGSAGLVFFVMGLQLLIAGIVMEVTGLERSLTLLNDELIILPGGLSRILGITTHLGIPVALPLWIIWLSLVMVTAGFLMFILNRKRLVTRQRFSRS